MQIGDLVKIISIPAVCDHLNKVGIVTSLLPATMMMPYEVLSVTFPNAEKISGISSRWVEVVVNANR